MAKVGQHGPDPRPGLDLLGVDWCLFRLASETSIKPKSLYWREAPLLDLNLTATVWSLVSPEGARQQGWIGGAAINPIRVRGWDPVIGEPRRRVG